MGLGGQRTVMLDFTVRTITNSNVLKIIFSSKHQIYSCSVEDGHNGKPKATIYQQGLDDGSSTSSVIGNFENKDQGNGTESANGNDKNDPVIASLISCASKVFQQTLIKPESLKLLLEHAKIPSNCPFLDREFVHPLIWTGLSTQQWTNYCALQEIQKTFLHLPCAPGWFRNFSLLNTCTRDGAWTFYN